MKMKKQEMPKNVLVFKKKLNKRSRDLRDPRIQLCVSSRESQYLKL